ncbi:MAG TPA: DedA family protein [Polyangiaceae bacterium]|jgi:membrane-associated protein|nr:DedA family protein [Polyangiaceae bacterium]
MLHTILDVVLHLDTHLAAWSSALGPSLYAVLFLVVFCETGLVVTPFLPGDSLLFAVGALAAVPSASIQILVVTAVLMLAAILGDTVNYRIGKTIGARAFAGEFRFIKQKHLERTKEFYERHGGKAIVLARFAPILRTFAPFVAGVGQMSYARFLAYNVGGGVAWVGSFVTAGYCFGNIPAVKSRFHLVVIAIIVISLIPAAIEAFRARSEPRTAA